jgi:hypothetical protein
MVALVQVESSGCKANTGDDKTSFGCGAVTLLAADTVGFHPSAKTLRTNPRVNLKISAAYLNWCIQKTGDYDRGLFCYNHGVAWAQSVPWFKKGCPDPIKRNHRPCDIAHDFYVAAIKAHLPRPPAVRTFPKAPQGLTLAPGAPGFPGPHLPASSNPAAPARQAALPTPKQSRKGGR